VTSLKPPSDAAFQKVHRTPPTRKKEVSATRPEKINRTSIETFPHPESRNYHPFYHRVQSMALSLHSCRVRTLRAAIFQSRLPQRHAYNKHSRDFKNDPRVQYPQQFSPTPTHIRPEHSSGFLHDVSVFLHSVLPKDRRERLGRWSAYTEIGMIGVLGSFWLWNQEEVPITGRKRFNFISHEHLEENEHKFFPKVVLLHFTMTIDQDKPSVLLPADHPVNVVVQKVFYRLLEAQGQGSSGWKIGVVRAPSHIQLPPIKEAEGSFFQRSIRH
jgi:hypothetical protein